MPDLEAEQPGLPPFSGKDGACPKCGCRCAETKWLIKPANAPYVGLRVKDLDPWYTNFLLGGDLIKAVQAGRLHVSPADWYPAEWQGRHCLICQYRWDEALAETEAT